MVTYKGFLHFTLVSIFRITSHFSKLYFCIKLELLIKAKSLNWHRKWIFKVCVWSLQKSTSRLQEKKSFQTDVFNLYWQNEKERNVQKISLLCSYSSQGEKHNPYKAQVYLQKDFLHDVVAYNCYWRKYKSRVQLHESIFLLSESQECIKCKLLSQKINHRWKVRWCEACNRFEVRIILI